jgi:hypothetical protein
MSSCGNGVCYFGYEDCIELLNDHARVLITPHGGCRVLLYVPTMFYVERFK